MIFAAKLEIAVKRTKEKIINRLIRHLRIFAFPIVASEKNYKNIISII